jgi:hypothetical protein
VSDTTDSNKKQPELLNRLRSFPGAAVAGAFASFASAAMGSQAQAAAARAQNPVLVEINLTGPTGAAQLEIGYAPALDFKPIKFRQSLAGIAFGPGDKIYALGDGEVRIFEPDGTPVRSWKAPDQARCIAVSREERIYVAAKGRVAIFDSGGISKTGFEVGGPGSSADITAIKVHSKEILVADASAKCIFRYDSSGNKTGEIGTQNKTRGFILPNRSLDIDVYSNGTVIATDSGRHRVSTWALDGTPVRQFGKFGVMNVEDFVGCCNPVNLAFTPDGRIVTAEKVVPRIKIFDAAGKILGMIGPEYFDSKCTHLYIAVDSKGRILVADPVRLETKLFLAMAKPGGRESI